MRFNSYVFQFIESFFLILRIDSKRKTYDTRFTRFVVNYFKVNLYSIHS